MRIIWSETARDDLRQIDRYLSQFDAATAARALRLIQQKLNLLKDYPHVGPALEDASRSLIVRGTTYVLIYAVLKDAIGILRVRDMREDWRSA